MTHITGVVTALTMPFPWLPVVLKVVRSGPDMFVSHQDASLRGHTHMRLARDTVAAIGQNAAHSAVDLPSYEPTSIDVGIVHVGVGGFHRSHEAMYVDLLLRTGVTDWGICGIGLLPGDSRMRDVLHDQDGLYTLMTVSPDGSSRIAVVGSIVEYLFAPDNPRAVLARLASPATRIVSLTITEGGYSVDDTTGEFSPQDTETIADLADNAPWTNAPRSALGILVAALAGRRERNESAFTVMSCDNIQGNGTVARTAVLGFAQCKDPELATWIGEHVAFPNSMVDRITPATTDATRKEVAEASGIDDEWPVRSEAFTQWVLEDRFTAGRPALERVGVQMVDDVEPYELMKLRLLNASHQVMAYLGVLVGHTYVHEACLDPVFRTFLLDYMHEEARPTLQPVPGIDLTSYCAQLIERFSSRYVADTLARQAVDGADRVTKFIIPVLRHHRRMGGPSRHCVLAVAAWSLYLEGRTELGEPITIIDRRAEDLKAAVAAQAERPGGFVASLPAVFGDLVDDGGFTQDFAAARRELVDAGVRQAMITLR